jgi:hypothetical protein
VVWNIHNPSMSGDDGVPSIYSYFQVHTDHPTNEMHQISAISGNTITFDSPVTISYRVSHGAQLTPMISGPTNAGVEELAVKGGDDSNIHFNTAAYAWAKKLTMAGGLMTALESIQGSVFSLKAFMSTMRSGLCPVALVMPSTSAAMVRPRFW